MAIWVRKSSVFIKAFCADFQPIRRTLTTLGATCVEQKEQVDYFFLLRTDAPACRRLKLRIENDQPRWIYSMFGIRRALLS